MAQLGRPERVVYTGKNLASGLEEVHAFVLKPNGAVLGPFPMQEFSQPEFLGFYYFDFETDKNTDDYGVYIVSIVSPEESYKTVTKIVYDQLSIEELDAIVDEVLKTIRLLNQVESEIEIEDDAAEIEVTMVEER